MELFRQYVQILKFIHLQGQAHFVFRTQVMQLDQIQFHIWELQVVVELVWNTQEAVEPLRKKIDEAMGPESLQYGQTCDVLLARHDRRDGLRRLELRVRRDVLLVAAERRSAT